MTDVGSLGEEAAKLLGAVEQWWREHAPAGTPHQGPECLVCPVCQLLAVLRTAQPEVFEHLTDAAGALLLAVKAGVEAQERQWARGRSAKVAVERIDVI